LFIFLRPFPDLDLESRSGISVYLSRGLLVKLKDTILSKMKEQENWGKQSKATDEEFAFEKIVHMCKKINNVLAEIESSTIKQYSSCPKTLQSW
jgi:hypothetical protein